MKKIILLISIVLLCGCEFKKNNEENNSIMTNFEERYYQRVRTCMYEGDILLFCKFNEEKYFIATTDKTIRFVIPYYDSLRQETYNYQIQDSMIMLDKIDFSGIDKMKYKIENNIISDSIIITKEMVYDETAEQKVMMTVNQVYDRITKEEYTKKIGVNNEE